MTPPAAPKRWLLLVTSGVALVVVGLIFKIADSVRESDAVVRNDKRIVDFFVGHRTPFWSECARVVTQFGSGWVIAPIVVVCVLALVFARRWHAALVVALSSIGAAVLVAMAKHIVGRPRPPVATRLVSAHGLAFPSGHAAQSVACYGAVAWLAWELDGSRPVRVVAGVAAAAIAVGVGLSRIYLGVHWPSDVVSGWLLGVGWLAALIGWFSRRGRAGAARGLPVAACA